MRVINLAVFLIAYLFLGMLISAQEPDNEALRQEEVEDYFQKWLNQDVTYIVSEEERSVFKSLSTPEEKEQFIEQFWFRRDPDPRTAENEFKEEHYRRIAYSNERFASGIAGWMTDRGRIYILHGPPAEIESHASGGRYERPMNEGGGSTSAYPFEIWRYRNIKGIGSDILLEFVDSSLSGEYRLALHPEEKDAMLYVPGAGKTLAEEMGLASKADRPWFSPGNRDSYPMMYETARDNPFYRYETYTMVQAPPLVKYNDLKELVSVSLNYESMAIQVHENFFRLNENEFIVPINVQLDNKELAFQTEGEHRVARVGVYGAVTSISNRLISEFEHDLVTSYSTDQMARALRIDSIYQKVLVLDRKQRYKLDLVVKDLTSGKLGVVRRAIVPPSMQGDELAVSSVILSNALSVLDSVPDQDEMFVLGDVKVRPNLRREFTVASPLGVYFQLYNAKIDQTTLEPSLEVTFQLLQDGQQLRQTIDLNGESTQYFSERRIVLLKLLGVEGLSPGDYQIQVLIKDRLSGGQLELIEPFKLVATPGSSTTPAD